MFYSYNLQKLKQTLKKYVSLKKMSKDTYVEHKFHCFIARTIKQKLRMTRNYHKTKQKCFHYKKFIVF